MRYCYIHDGAGGNNVKSRTTRSEIEYNWIEGAAFHELDLIGPDPKAQKMPPGFHCDADVIGNVLVIRSDSQGTLVRLGSDGNDSSHGRYNFVNNTIIVQSKVAAGSGLVWLKGQIDAVRLWNNVFFSEVGPMKILRSESAPPPPVLAGGGNWLPTVAVSSPSAWKAIRGTDPGFMNADAADYRPAPASPLIGAGILLPAALRPHGIPAMDAPSAEAGSPRPPARQKDIGAYPFAPRGAGHSGT
jgi:hypothetical protein